MMLGLNWSIIWTVMKKELRNYFTTPIGHIFLLTFLLASTYLAFEPGKGSFFYQRQADMRSLFSFMPWTFLIFVPAVSMRLWAEERKSSTIELLLTLPVKVKDVVLGKFFAAWAFLAFALLLTFPMIVSLFYLGKPDVAVLTVGYIGAIFLAGSFLGVGMFFSALSKGQVISFILSVVAIYILCLAASPPILDFLSGFIPKFFVELIESMGLIDHFESLQRGVVRFSDLFGFSVVIVGWICATVLILDEKKAV